MDGSSGSASTITFKTIPRGYTDGDFTMGMNITTFVRTLNGHTHEGILGDDNGLIYSTDTSFQLCNNKWRIESGGLYHLGCQEWTILTINPSHMEFKDQHGGIIQLMR